MDRQMPRAIAIPGAPTQPEPVDAPETEGQTKFVSNKGRKSDLDPRDARIAELEAQVAAAARLPQPVFEPVTPHGKAALASSETAHMTVAEVMAAINTGALREPMNNYLCSDGYYSRRGG